MPLAQLFSVPSTRAAGGVGGGLHQRVAGGRAADGKRRVGGEAARVLRRPHHLPAAVPAARPRSPTRRARPAPCAPSRRVQVFMPPACSRPSSVYSWFITSRPRRLPSSGVEVHAVVVHAHLHRLLGGAVGCVGRQAGMLAGDAHRLAPGREHGGRVALGHDHGVGRWTAAMPLKPSRGAGAGRGGRPAQPASGAKHAAAASARGRRAARCGAPGRRRRGCWGWRSGCCLPSCRSPWPCSRLGDAWR